MTALRSTTCFSMRGKGSRTFWMQTFPVKPFDCVTWNYGAHQGDMERVAVRLVPARGRWVSHLAGLLRERHGRGIVPSRADPMRNGRILVYPALLGHSPVNIQKRVTGYQAKCPFVNDGNAGIFLVTSVLASPELPGAFEWNPHQRSIAIHSGSGSIGAVNLSTISSGLNTPAIFGQTQRNALVAGTHWNGENLSWDQWTLLSTAKIVSGLLGI